MTLYLVRWEIEIEADNPLKAAEQARKIQLRQGGQATVFDVYEPMTGGQPREGLVRAAKIDLTFPEQSERYDIEDILSPCEIEVEDVAETNAAREKRDNREEATDPRN